ncbi:MAG: ABC transporter permease [Actinobacteria bacterium]|nr:ABC transporter permease [Actinomycetota bacterium]
MTALATYAHVRDLAMNLTLRELKGKYKRSVLGWSWSLLNPLATALIFTMVFKVFFQAGTPLGRPSGLSNFPLWLLCGLLPWNYLANSLNGATESLVANANLIKKVYFPRQVLVVANVASWMVPLLVEFGVLAVLLLAFGNFVLPWLPMVLVLILLQTGFVLGIGMVLGAANVYFRDVKHLIGILLQAFFYATPIVYPLDVVPEQATLFGLDLPVRSLYRLNPMVPMVEAFRDVLYDLRFPPLGDLLYVAAWGLGCMAVGLVVFSRLEPRLAEEL